MRLAIAGDADARLKRGDVCSLGERISKRLELKEVCQMKCRASRGATHDWNTEKAISRRIHTCAEVTPSLGFDSRGSAFSMVEPLMGS